MTHCIDLTTHPDWLALCAAVCGTPGDDVLRYACSDWLRENGHEEYGEFIHVQVELGRFPHQFEGEALVGRYNALRRRERELGRAYCVHWFAPPPGFVVRWGPGAGTSDEVQRGMSLYCVRRGFVSEVRGSLAVLLGGPCGCGGTDEERARVGLPRCPACSGTGDTLGVLPRLVGRQPVEAVGVVGKEPYAVETGFGEWWWHAFNEYDGSEDGDTEYDGRHHLPGDVFDLLNAECDYIDSDMCIPFKRFDSRDAALAALSAAVLKRAGELAPPSTPVV